MITFARKFMPMEVKHIHKSFGKQAVLQDVSFSLHPGEVLGLLGPNGAGKSTLMKIIIGLWTADTGEINAPSHIGYLPEQNPLYEEMYVREYLQFMSRLLYHGEKRNTRPNPNEVESLIQRVGLTSEANKKIGTLSKGYRQRVGLAQALLGDPELLILDEPTTGLDPNQLVEIRQLIREVGNERMVILSTHIMQEVEAVCSRVIVLNHGQIKADETIENITNIEQLFLNATRGI